MKSTEGQLPDRPATAIPATDLSSQALRMMNEIRALPEVRDAWVVWRNSNDRDACMAVAVLHTGKLIGSGSKQFPIDAISALHDRTIPTAGGANG